MKAALIILILLALLFLSLAVTTLLPQTEVARKEAELASQHLEMSYGWFWYAVRRNRYVLLFHLVALSVGAATSIGAARMLLTGRGIERGVQLLASCAIPLFLGVCAALLKLRVLPQLPVASFGYLIQGTWELRVILWAALLNALVPAVVTLLAIFRYRSQQTNARDVA